MSRPWTRLARGLALAGLAAAALPLLAAAGPATTPPGAAPASWPQWGGPDRNFTLPAAGLAETWPEGGPRRLWSRELGDAFSGVAAADGRLFTLLRRGEDELAVALEAATGKTLWERPYPAPFSAEYDMSHGPGPHATPLVAGERVFTAGATGKLTALDAASGKLLWQHDLIAGLGGTLRVNGYASSPIAFGDTVIAQVGGVGHALVAFRQADGAIAWQRHDFGNSASSPLLISLDGQPQLVAFLSAEVVGLDPASGDLLWRHPCPAEYGLNVSLPVWGEDGVLFLSSSYGNASRALKLARKAGATEVQELWSTNRMRLQFSNAVRLGGRIYGSSGDFGPAPFTALDLSTGAVLWRNRSLARASVIAVGERLLLLDEDGNLALASAGEAGLTIHARAKLLDNPAWTPPTLVGTTLYLRDRKVILAVDLGPTPPRPSPSPPGAR